MEDNEMGRQMVRTLLEHLHLQVIEAVDGADALAKIAAADFALVLMDIQMPVMDGITAAKAIRRLEQPQKANVPIIAMTAYMEIEIEQQFDSASFNGCVSKPIELEKLYHQLQRFLPDLSQATSVAPVCEDNCSALRHALPQINVTAALRRSGNDVELYRNLLQKFYVQFSPSSNKLQHKIDTQDYRAARFIAHDLKGAAGTLGAEEMQQCANELEQQLANEQPPAALAATQLALQNFLALIQALDSGEEQKNSSATTLLSG
ncbi:MAG: response regulator [Desulfuromonas sp.]|nr:response regulator [Desulfuromonas sp.]